MLQERSTSIDEEDKEDRHSPVEDDSAQALVQEVAKQLQVGLRIIEPIPEEREEDLEASNGHQTTTEPPRVEPVGEEQGPEMEDSDALTKKDIATTGQASAMENEPTDGNAGLKEGDTINRVLGEVIAKRKETQATKT